MAAHPDVESCDPMPPSPRRDAAAVITIEGQVPK